MPMVRCWWEPRLRIGVSEHALTLWSGRRRRAGANQGQSWKRRPIRPPPGTGIRAPRNIAGGGLESPWRRHASARGRPTKFFSARQERTSTSPAPSSSRQQTQKKATTGQTPERLLGITQAMQRKQHQLALGESQLAPPMAGLIARRLFPSTTRAMNAQQTMPPTLVTPPQHQLGQAHHHRQHEGLTRADGVDSNCFGQLPPKKPNGHRGGTGVHHDVDHKPRRGRGVAPRGVQGQARPAKHHGHGYSSRFLSIEPASGWQVA